MLQPEDRAPYCGSRESSGLFSGTRHWPSKILRCGDCTTAALAASLAVMARVPLLVVAKNLGHKDTRMVEHHYGHLAPSFITEAIRAGAPVYGIEASKGVVPLR
jgi:hypothetical protein